MRLPLLSLLVLSLLLLGRHSMAEDDFEDEEEEDGSVADEAEAEEEAEPASPKEQIFYERPVPVDKVHFYEPFDTRAEFIKKWIYSQAKKDGAEADLAKYDGKWGLEEPRENPITNDLGLILKSKAKHHAIAANLDEPFRFSGKPLIAQYEVRFQNGQDCGGAYIKLLSQDSSLKLKSFTDKTPYTIMFGPDKCGNDHKLHFIFRHKNPKTGEYEEKHAAKPTGKLDSYFSDKKTHLYTLIINPDNSYEVQVDKVVVMSGNLLETMTPPVNPPKEIEDPDDKKPAEWDDREKIQDPSATKPEDWDESQPAQIQDEAATMPAGWLEDQGPTVPDPEAAVPEDWDESMDGEWEAPLIDNPLCKDAPGCGPWSPPMIANPLYKGKWSAPMIDNPAYQGEWKPKIIPNPAYFLDEQPYKMTPIGAIGLELWSMSSEIAFDNFLVADNLTVVEELTQLTWEVKARQEGAAGGKGVFGSLSAWAAERPWLWAVYLVAVLLPITLLCICLCPRSGPVKPEDIAAHRKKFDDPEPDTIPEEEDEEEEEDGGAGAEEAVEEVEAESDPRGGGDAAVEEVKAGGGDATDNSQEEGDDADVEDSVPSQDSPKKTSPRKRKTRKE